MVTLQESSTSGGARTVKCSGKRPRRVVAGQLSVSPVGAPPSCEAHTLPMDGPILRWRKKDSRRYRNSGSLNTPKSKQGGNGVPPPDRYWTKLALSQWPHPTDLCSVCGHVRSLHRQYVMGIYQCEAGSGCDCGPMPFPYHVAGMPPITETVTNKDVAFPISQPRKPNERPPDVHS